MPTLHVVVPFYEEAGTLEECLRAVMVSPLPQGWRSSVVVVDDGSSEGAATRAKEISGRLGVRFLQHERNRGKGAALRTGFADALSHGTDDDIVIVQDADLEYEPHDYANLLEPLLGGRADVVFGNRWADGVDGRFHRKLHRTLNRGLTVLSNLLSGLSVHDMECCYKLFRAPILGRVMPWLTEDRFGVEPQIAAVLGRLRLRVAEVGVQYRPRSFAEGKKIRPKDGFRALWVIVRESVRPAPAGDGT